MSHRSHNKSLSALLVALVMLLGSGPARAAESPASGYAEAAALVMAEVDGEAITLADLRAAFGTRHSGHGGMLIGEEIIRVVLDKAINERLMIHEGYRMGLPETPEFKAAVEAKSDIARLEALETRFIEEASVPSDPAVKAAYDLLPRQMRVFLLDCPDERTAREALGRIRIGEPFPDVARQISIHSTRTKGGDLGWISWGLLDERTERIVLKAEKGKLVGPFEMEDGVRRILKVEDERVGEPPPLAESRRMIETILERRSKKRLREELLASVRKSNPPVEDADAIRKLLSGKKPAEGEKQDPPDDAVLMKTSTGLELTAGRVRGLARKSGQPVEEIWRASSEDALLIDEARRRIPLEGQLALDVQVFADALVRNEVERASVLKGLKMDGEAAKAYYESHPEEFMKPASYRMRQIATATREEAGKVREALLAGGDFAALAKERSIDTSSSANGGDLGWAEAPPEGVPEAIAALEPGGVTEVLETPMGFAVVQLMEVRPATLRPFEQVRQEAAQREMIRRQGELREAFVERLKEVSKVRIHENAVARAVEIQDAVAKKRFAVQSADGGGHGD